MSDSDLRVVFVGAASPQWGYKILRDIVATLSSDSACVKKRPVVVLEDTDAINLRPVQELGELMSRRCGGKVRIEATTDQREALTGAHFVIICLAVGSLESMLHDIEIPYDYGIFMPVGDSISIGGAIRAARNIPTMVDIARDMEAVSAPGAWMLNLSNPMSMLTRAVARETTTNVIGLCHEVYAGLGEMCRTAGVPYPEWRQHLEVSVLGINHCAWLQRCTVNGEDTLAKLRSNLDAKGFTLDSRRLYDSPIPELRHQNVKFHLFLKYGVLPYSGDRHNVEFFTEFCNRETNLGADWGVLLTRVQSRLVDWRGGARQEMQELVAGTKELSLDVSQEAVSRIIKAIAVDDPFYDVSNLPYEGDHLPGIPQGAVIERMCLYDGHGPHPDAVDPLPDVVQEHFALHAQIVEDVVEASVTGSRAQMIGALRRDPLLQNMDAAKIPELWDRVAAKSREWLNPGFF